MTLEKLLNILCEKGWKPRGYESELEEFLLSNIKVEGKNE